jgi:hypothetical protein
MVCRPISADFSKQGLTQMKAGWTRIHANPNGTSLSVYSYVSVGSRRQARPFIQPQTIGVHRRSSDLICVKCFLRCCQQAISKR